MTAAWHVRLKQYYPSRPDGIRHSRVVTGLNTSHVYKEKIASSDLPGAIPPRKRKISEKDKRVEKKKMKVLDK